LEDWGEGIDRHKYANDVGGRDAFVGLDDALECIQELKTLRRQLHVDDFIQDFVLLADVLVESELVFKTVFVKQSTERVQVLTRFVALRLTQHLTHTQEILLIAVIMQKLHQFQKFYPQCGFLLLNIYDFVKQLVFSFESLFLQLQILIFVIATNFAVL